MFSGIVEEIGSIRQIAGGKLSVAAVKVMQDLKPGDSIAVNGVCLTVTLLEKDCFYTDLMPETLRRTGFASLHYGDAVNLERALTVGGRIGGHFVQGHIDGQGRILSLVPDGEAVIMKVGIEPQHSRYIVDKGFIALDGVSLTVIDPGETAISVSLVSFTRDGTTLGRKRQGHMLNIELDILAKYVEKLGRANNTETVLTSFLQGQHRDTR